MSLYFNSMPNLLFRLFTVIFFIVTIFPGCSRPGSNADPVTPSLAAATLISVGINYAVISGSITNNGNASITARGFCWSQNPNPTLSNSFLISSSTGNTFTDTIRGLAYNTTYYVRSYATNSAGTSYSTEIQLRTQNTQFTIGQLYGGGKIFYIDSTGEHGFVYAPRYFYTHYIWAPYPLNSLLVGTTSPDVGAGRTNTFNIISAGINASNTAAKVCDAFVLNGYDDWFLPSYGELALLKATIGFLDMAGDLFWTSTEANQHNAYLVRINATSTFGYDVKDNSWAVIPVRQF